VEDSIVRAIKAVEGTLSERSFAKLLLGSSGYFKHTNGAYPLGILKGYDNDSILELLEEMLAQGRLVKKGKYLFPGSAKPEVPARSALQLTEDDIPF
jgi:hypothetical protein